MEKTNSKEISKIWLNTLGLYSKKQKQQLDTAINSLTQEISQAISFVNTMTGDKIRVSQHKNNQTQLIPVLNSLHEFLKDLETKEKQRMWFDKGLAFFASLLRDEISDIKSLCDTIILNVVRYLNANQGAIFLHDPSNRTLTGTSFYAYDKKRFVEKVMFEEDGLIGECFMQNDLIYMTQVPDKYVTITSGLGESTASYLMLVPITLYEQKLGVLELASFFPFETHHIDFLKKLSENIAGALIHANNLHKASELLKEATLAAKQLRIKEEALIQNIEELTLIKEQITKQNQELESSRKIAKQKSEEMEEMQKRNMELMESKLKTQEEIFQTIITKLQTKLQASMLQTQPVS